MLKTPVALLLALLLTACASVPMASLDDDAKAKNFTPLDRKASVYIYRSEHLGGANPMSVSVNARTLGQTAAMTYFRLDVPSGKYNAESHAENVSTLGLAVETGRSYFVWQEVKMGMWMARSHLQQVDEATGRAEVSQCKLIANALQAGDLQPADAPTSVQPEDSTSQRLRELENMKKERLITEEEYQKKKAQLLEKL